MELLLPLLLLPRLLVPGGILDIGMAPSETPHNGHDANDQTGTEIVGGGGMVDVDKHHMVPIHPFNHNNNNNNRHHHHNPTR